jgi:hypothetical protein
LHVVISEGLEKLTFGSILFEASARARGIASMPAFDAERYPILARSIAANPFDDEGRFVQALRIFLAGVKVLTDDGTGAAPPQAG